MLVGGDPFPWLFMYLTLAKENQTAASKQGPWKSELRWKVFIVQKANHELHRGTCADPTRPDTCLKKPHCGEKTERGKIHTEFIIIFCVDLCFHCAVKSTSTSVKKEQPIKKLHVLSLLQALKELNCSITDIPTARVLLGLAPEVRWLSCRSYLWQKD